MFYILMLIKDIWNEFHATLARILQPPSKFQSKFKSKCRRNALIYLLKIKAKPPLEIILYKTKGFEKDKGNLAFSCENKTQTGNEINLAPATRNEFSQDLLR